MAKQFTNREEVYKADPENWTFQENAPAPRGTFAKGATEVTGTGAVPTQQEPDWGEGVPPDPRLGVREQGNWDLATVRRNFPGMFQDTSQWLDPAEQAKKEAGLSYDPNKRYDEDEYRAKEIVSGTGPGGQPLRQQLPQWQPLDRNKFESFVFGEIQKATGIRNPFTYNPHDAVLKADAELPDLFNHVFQGIATWKDLPNLSKEQRAYWEDIKKQHHARAFDGAKAKKEQAMQMYGWMMQKFDMENRAELANTAREQKRIAAEEARSGKAGTFRPLLNEDTGQMELHELMPDGHTWKTTGKRVGLASFEDMMPPDVKVAYNVVKGASSGIGGDPVMLMLLEKMDPELAKTFMAGQKSKYSAEDVEASKSIVSKWLQGYLKKGRAQQEATAQPGARAGGVDPQLAMIKITEAFKRGQDVSKAVDGFKKRFFDQPQLHTELDNLLSRVKGRAAKGEAEARGITAEDFGGTGLTESSAETTAKPEPDESGGWLYSQEELARMEDVYPKSGRGFGPLRRILETLKKGMQPSPEELERLKQEAEKHPETAVMLKKALGK